MGRYNRFVATLTDPETGRPVECEFQADAGLLEYAVFRLGDRLLSGPPRRKRGRVGRSFEALENNLDFWVYGLGDCGGGVDEPRWAKLHFRDGAFASAELVPPPEDPFAWGYE